MKVYAAKLVDGTDDQYKIYTDNRGTMLCDDQWDGDFVKLSDVLAAVDACEGDIDLLRFKLPKERDGVDET
jgi:hypothetical protein